jgi:hypothetical protein
MRVIGKGVYYNYVVCDQMYMRIYIPLLSRNGVTVITMKGRGHVQSNPPHREVESQITEPSILRAIKTN